MFVCLKNNQKRVICLKYQRYDRLFSTPAGKI